MSRKGRKPGSQQKQRIAKRPRNHRRRWSLLFFIGGTLAILASVWILLFHVEDLNTEIAVLDKEIDDIEFEVSGMLEDRMAYNEYFTSATSSYHAMAIIRALGMEESEEWDALEQSRMTDLMNAFLQVREFAKVPGNPNELKGMSNEEIFQASTNADFAIKTRLPSLKHRRKSKLDKRQELTRQVRQWTRGGALLQIISLLLLALVEIRSLRDEGVK